MDTKNPISEKAGRASKRLSSDQTRLFDDSIADVFDSSSLAMMRLNADLSIAFGNKKALDICGVASFEGVSLRSLIAGESDMAKIAKEFSHRREGISSEYEIRVWHRPDGREIPVRVVGMPILTSDGTLSGVLAIFRSIEIERQIEAFNQAMSQAAGWMPILKAVCDQLKSVAPCEISIINAYSEDERHLRTLFRDDPRGAIRSDQRWYLVPEFINAFVHKPDIMAFSIADLLNLRELESYRTDPNIQRLIQQGFQQILRYPIFRGKRLVASIICMSMDSSAFTQNRLSIIRALPIANALHIALHYMATEELQFRFDLIKDMFACSTPKLFAELLTMRLVAHYGWKSVSVYWVDQAANKLRLMHRYASPEIKQEKPGDQDLSTGLLGHAYRTGQDINIEDASAGPAFHEIVHQLPPSTLSELCMPIRVDGRIKAILEVEDTERSAFSHDEQLILRSLLDEIGNLLGAAQTQSLITQTFLATPSAVFVTDSSGTIIKTNPAAESILGYTESELANTKISDYFADMENSQVLLKEISSKAETLLKTKSGIALPVIAGAHELEDFGSWVISAKDISYRKRLEQLEMLGQMYRELAAQMKTPLSLVSSWLQRLQKQKESSNPEIATVLAKTLTQAKKLDLTFERLALYDQDSGYAPYNEVLLDLTQLLQRLLNELPEPERAQLIRNLPPDDRVYIHGDAYQIAFIIETIFSYLFRFLPEDEKIHLDLGSDALYVRVAISGFSPMPHALSIASDATPEATRRMLNDIALGDPVISRFMENHRGRYSKARIGEATTRFELMFPKAQVEA